MQIPYAILGVVLLVFLLWKGFQLWRLYRQRLRLKLEPVPAGPEGVETRNPELPGRVRVVPRVGAVAPAAKAQPDEVPYRHTPGLRMRAPEPELPTDEAEDLGLPVHLVEQQNDVALVDVIVVGAPSVVARDAVAANPEPVVVADAADIPVLLEPVAEQDDDDAPLLFPGGDAAPVLASAVDVPVLIEPSVAAVQQVPAAAEIEQQDLFAGEPVAVPPRRDLAARASALYEKEALEPVNTLGTAQRQEKVHEEVQDVIAVHVICRGIPFNGEDLLRCILSYGLRFGEMSIFHRHEQPTGQGKVLFSMAKAVEPGTFDLETMTGEDITGVSFFQSLPGVNSIQAFDIMIDTAKRLATELNGDILDLQQIPLTRQLIEHYRERVMEFERRRLTARQ